MVERVLTGDRLICRLVTGPTQCVQTAILIAGIRAPATSRTNVSDGTEQPAEPFGDQAHNFVEQRLLQRGVKVKLLGVSPNNVLVAEVMHPVGNIAEFVLQEGLARCFDHHSTWLGPEMAKLRAAERQARDKRIGLFESHVARSNGSSQEIEAIVSRVMSADTLIVKNKAGSQKRVNLSSIRQPKPSDPKQAPFVAEAKEFMRKRLIGKHVGVTIDGKRAATDGYDEREMATVTLAGKNVGLLLVEAGFASVIRHRMDDADRSPIYDELLAAEQSAQTSGQGMWNPKPPKLPEYVDYSASLDQAKRQLNLYARQKRIPAIVDFVKSGSRFTVLIPRDNAKLTFVLSGISCPRSARNPTDKAEPFGQEAHDLANRRCMQRDVELDIEGTDKVGGFIGTLYINRENFAKNLVEEGFASVHAYSAEKSGNGAELFAAEERAKEAHKGMWHDWTPDTDAAEHDHTQSGYTNGDSAQNPDQRPKDYRDVVVRYIDPDSARLKLQQLGTGATALSELMTSFAAFHLSSAGKQSLSSPPNAGDYVSAKFNEDNTWYRARIRRNDREAKTAEIVYVDYGNSETVPWSSLRPLDASKFGVQKLRGQAVDAVLSYLQFPTSPEYLQEAVRALDDMTAGRGQDSLVAKVDMVDPKDGTLYVTLFNPDQSSKLEQSINAEVLRHGLAMLPKKIRSWEKIATDVLATLASRQDEAKRERKGMWEYGDLSED